MQSRSSQTPLLSQMQSAGFAEREPENNQQIALDGLDFLVYTLTIKNILASYMNSVKFAPGSFDRRPGAEGVRDMDVVAVIGLLIILVSFDLAALRWGADSRYNLNHPTERSL
jgi:hypothetical protein